MATDKPVDRKFIPFIFSNKNFIDLYCRFTGSDIEKKTVYLITRRKDKEDTKSVGYGTINSIK